MPPPTGRDDRPDEADLMLERVEERVRKVQHLDPFHFSQRDDGRFRCQLERPVAELRATEIREALTVLEALADLLRERLAERGQE